MQRIFKVEYRYVWCVRLGQVSLHFPCRRVGALVRRLELAGRQSSSRELSIGFPFVSQCVRLALGP